MCSTDMKELWLRTAEECIPELNSRAVPADSIVRIVPDKASFQGWMVEREGTAADLGDRMLGPGDSIILDFGEHFVGRFSVDATVDGTALDAPLRVTCTFGEVPAELVETFDPDSSWLSRSWMQDETITVDVLPGTLELPRRYAFRYVKIALIAAARKDRVRFSNPVCTALTSAPAASLEQLDSPLAGIDGHLDRVAQRTLRDCMQTVYEDGPKRDRRLWLGDMRLQALAGYVSLPNHDLVRRCLYLFAGTARDDGLVPACIYEFPRPTTGGQYALDYAALFGVSLHDFYTAGGDRETVDALWPVALHQAEFVAACVDDTAVLHEPEGTWTFVDWQKGLYKDIAVLGTFVWSLRRCAQLAEITGRAEESARLCGSADRIARAVPGTYWDENRKAFVSPDGQVSWASQAWMVLAGIVEGQHAADLMTRAMADDTAVRPAGPYLYHYVVEALELAGLKDAARELLRSYWGGMLDRGADTFWEVFDPADDRLSPYGNHLMNSYCHAWSCTPTWFLRREG